MIHGAVHKEHSTHERTRNLRTVVNPTPTDLDPPAVISSGNNHVNHVNPVKNTTIHPVETLKPLHSPKQASFPFFIERNS